ncbi:MAG: hypothetical protein KJS92_05205 [Bacteroidetes bacterium]|nr:hypothetical protein [Bacteroidota bacterium]
MATLRKDKASLLWLPLGALLFLLIDGGRGWPEGGQDSWNHFLYGRWAFRHPELFLDQWGKPLYTLLISLPAQLGFHAVLYFNIACSLFTGLLMYRFALRLQWKHPWLAYPLTWFTPVLFGNTVSALTEPLNALLVAFVLFLFASERKTAAVLIASLLPLVRSEGYVIIAAIACYLLLSRGWKLLPLLCGGTLLLALAGWLDSGDPLWIIHSNPYLRFNAETRWHPGSGDFFHYLHQQRLITGTAGLVLSIAGWLAALAILSEQLPVSSRLRLLLGHLRERLKGSPEHASLVFLLAGGIAAAYFLAHSYLWWSGSMGSHGLLRVFAVIVPCFVVAQHFLLNLLAGLPKMNKILPPLLIAGTALLGINAYHTAHYALPWNFRTASIPAPPQASTVQRSMAWLKAHNLDSRVLVHQLPFFNMMYELDHWEKPELAKTFYIWSIDWRDNFSRDWMPVGSIVLYDGYHAGRDGFLPKDSIMNSSRYQLLHHEPFQDEAGKSNPQFDVWLFEKQR